MKKKAQRILATIPERELISKGVLKHVYEVPHPEHVLIKMQHNIVYDVVDEIFYVFQTGIADAYVYNNGG